MLFFGESLVEVQQHAGGEGVGGLFSGAAVTATDAYAKLYLAEADAVRRLVRAGYADAAAGCDRAAAEAWAEAPKRFAPGAADLIRLLSPP